MRSFIKPATAALRTATKTSAFPASIARVNLVHPFRVSQFSNNLVRNNATISVDSSSASQPTSPANQENPAKKVHQAAGHLNPEVPQTVDPVKEKDFVDSHHSRPSIDTNGDWVLPHNIWSDKYAETVEFTHLPPKDFVDNLALNTIRLLRFNFDWMSGYSFGRLTEKKAMTRVVFLETVAGVPGSIGGILRHLASLRSMKRDGGWIHTLFEEAENERMHLLTFLQMRQPGKFMRGVVFLTQGVFFNFFFLAYLVSPRYCHRLVGYLEEQAVKTYSHIIEEIDAPNGNLKHWATQQAPEIAKKYWQLGDDATVRKMMSHIRADEAHHRDVNHTLGSLKPNELNPYLPGH